MEQVTIIVPVYNVEEYLNRCLKSLVYQTYKNIEILLIDDGSTDQSGKICDLFATEYKNIKAYHKKNGGVSSARNYGLELMSENGYVMFVDPDDWVERQFVEIMLQEQNKNADSLIACKWRVINRAGTMLKKYDENKSIILYPGEERFLAILDENQVCGYVWNKIFKKTIILQNKISFNEQVQIAEDQLFCIEYAKYINEIRCINYGLYNYLYRKNSATLSGVFLPNKFASFLLALKLVGERIPDEYMVARQHNKDALLNQSIYYWIRMYKTGQFAYMSQEQRKEIIQLKKEATICSLKYKIYFSGVLFYPRVLYFFISIGMSVRKLRNKWKR